MRMQLQTCRDTLRSLDVTGQRDHTVHLHLDDLVRMRELRALRIDSALSVRIYSRTAVSTGVDQPLPLSKLEFNYTPIHVESPTALTR